MYTTYALKKMHFLHIQTCLKSIFMYTTYALLITWGPVVLLWPAIKGYFSLHNHA